MAAADWKYKHTCFLGIDKGMFSYINYQACIECSFIYDEKIEPIIKQPRTLNSAVTNRTVVAPWVETSNFSLQDLEDYALFWVLAAKTASKKLSVFVETKLY